MVYPANLETIGNTPANLGGGAVTHTSQTDQIKGLVERIQAELGLDPAGAYATVRARLDALAAAQGLAAGSVDATKLNQTTIWNPLNNGWVAWTPALTRANIGGGTAAGVYRRIGATVEFHARITFGGTASFNTGILNVSLPFSVAETHTTGPAVYQIEALLKKVSCSWLRDGADDSSKAVIILPSGADALSGQVGRTAGGSDLPAAPVNNTRIYYSGTYRTNASNSATSLAS